MDALQCDLGAYITSNTLVVVLILQRYRQAFAANDLGGDRIGVDEFVKIVTGSVRVESLRGSVVWSSATLARSS